MSKLLQNLAEIRQMGGHDPLPDPTQIAGFGPGNPPAPPYVPPEGTQEPLPEDWLNPEVDMPVDPPGVRPPPSPLIPRPQAAPQPPPVAFADVLKGLVVIDRLGAWKGREVNLTDSDEKSIRAVVLNAIKRELEADLNAVKAPRRPRRPRTTPKPPNGQEAQPEAPVRRRGRPRGSLLARTP